jgi:3'-5' exoribonuclease
VEHMILSHHGQLEFGSPKLPQFPEALLLHYIDDMDSKMECMRALIENDRQVEGCFTAYSPALERTALKKERYLRSASPAPVRPAVVVDGFDESEEAPAATVAHPAMAAHPLFVARPEPMSAPTSKDALQPAGSKQEN